VAIKGAQSIPGITREEMPAGGAQKDAGKISFHVFTQELAVSLHLTVMKTLTVLSDPEQKHNGTNRSCQGRTAAFVRPCLSAALGVLLEGASKKQLNLPLHRWTASPPRNQLGDQKDDKQGKEEPGEGDARVNTGKAENPQHEEYSY
jgi:hypothetical protein